MGYRMPRNNYSPELTIHGFTRPPLDWQGIRLAVKPLSMPPCYWKRVRTHIVAELRQPLSGAPITLFQTYKYPQRFSLGHP